MAGTRIPLGEPNLGVGLWVMDHGVGFGSCGGFLRRWGGLFGVPGRGGSEGVLVELVICYVS